jgi:nucleotide-binding universal stress UspA family protein
VKTGEVIDMPKFKKILCPTDFSEASYEGIAKAVELIEGTGGEVCIVHVAQAVADKPLKGIAPYAQSESVRRAEAVSTLCAVLEERVPAHVRARPLLKYGDAAAEIVRAAREEAADLIVLTTHGGNGWRHGVIGAVADEILRKAHCPVLTISGPASGKVPSALGGRAHLNGTAVKKGALKPDLTLAASKRLLHDGD